MVNKGLANTLSSFHLMSMSTHFLFGCTDTGSYAGSASIR